MPFDEWDKQEIEAARLKLWKVYQSNYGAPGMQKELGRLGTIINKLNYLLREDGDNDGTAQA